MNALELFSLRGRTAIVTGGVGFLGRHHCKALADAGATVVVSDLDLGQCQELAKSLGNEAFGWAADVTDIQAIRDLLAQVMAHTGRVDVLVNNAAINERIENSAMALEESRFETLSLARWRQSLEVNVTGVFVCSQVIGSKMVELGGGSIINIASTYGIVAPDQSLYRAADGTQRFFKSAAYPTSKGAVIALTRYLASYWGRVGVRVNALSPGGVEDGQEPFFLQQYSRRTPLARMAAPGDYMGALVFLASDASSYMTGADLVVDGGFTIW
ncbi:MAG: SDR family oxidoreductase [Gammaproteobacteria bacterium]